MDRKTVIAFAVIILIILLVPYYYKMVLPPPPTPPVSRDSTVIRDTLVAKPQIPETLTSLIPAPVDPSRAPVTGEFPFETEPRTVVVETPLYRMAFSTRGAVLTSCLLKNYKSHPNGHVELIRADATDNLNLVLYQKGNPLDLQSIQFQPDKASLEIPAEDEGTITFIAQSSGSLVKKSFLFSGKSYKIDLRIQTKNLADLDPNYELSWGSGLAITEQDTAQDLSYSKAYAFMGGELETFDAKGDKDLSGGAEGETQWVALRGKYFEVALLPLSQPAAGSRLGIQAQPQRGRFREKVFRVALLMTGELNDQPASFSIYCGPLDQKLITAIHPQLEATMNWGWNVIAPFSKGILWSLKGLHLAIPNYGVVLIIFSIIIKIIVWPLTYKSTRSMSRMAALQPKMKELQEKLKGQPEKLNRATMQLYKDEKVNPFSGCWPTLLQMPLLYALFIVFRSTIELRGQPFVFWIKDLSMPDVIAHLPFSIPLYGNTVAILPIVMGITQFYMSKIMMTDPKQKFNLYFMSVFMVVIFNTLPSGLSLYYTLFNVWTYLQQVWMQKQGLTGVSNSSRS